MSLVGMLVVGQLINISMSCDVTCNSQCGRRAKIKTIDRLYW